MLGIQQRRRFASWLAASLLAGAATPLPAQAAPAGAPLTLLTEDYPPYNYSVDPAQPVTGLSTDIILAMGKQAGVAMLAPRITGWNRALVLTQETPNTCVYSTFRNPQREGRYKWVGPLINAGLALYARADSGIQLKSLEDARAYTLGSYHGSGSAHNLRERGFKVVDTSDDNSNLRVLAAGHIDLWISSPRNGDYLTRQEGTAIKQVLVIAGGQDTDMYLACNKDLPDATVAALNAGLKALKKRGVYAAIVKKYR